MRLLICKQGSSKTFNSNKNQMKIEILLMYLVPGND